MALSQDHGYVSVIQPEYIQSMTFNADAESKLLRGNVQFEAPKLYAGKVNFAARFHAGHMQVSNSRCPTTDSRLPSMNKVAGVAKQSCHSSQ
jgi:hypothetical protein